MRSTVAGIFRNIALGEISARRMLRENSFKYSFDWRVLLSEIRKIEKESVLAFLLVA